MFKNKFLFCSFLVLFILILFSPKAHAYINPGTGSDFSQMLLGIFASIIGVFKFIVSKIKSVFKISKKENIDYE